MQQDDHGTHTKLCIKAVDSPKKGKWERTNVHISLDLVQGAERCRMAKSTYECYQGRTSEYKMLCSSSVTCDHVLASILCECQLRQELAFAQE